MGDYLGRCDYCGVCVGGEIMNFIGKLKAEWSPAVSVVSETPKQAESDTLANVLAELQKHGRVTLGMYSNKHSGWHCACEMHISLNNSKFEVRSKGFDAPTPLQAAQECLENVRAAFSNIGGLV